MMLCYSVSANFTMAADVFITTGLVLYLSVTVGVLTYDGEAR